MSEQNSEQKSWIARVLDEGEKILPVSTLGLIGIASFVVVVWLLTTVQGRDVSARFVPTVAPAIIGADDQRKKEALLAAMQAGQSDPLDESEKKQALISLAQRVENGTEQMLTEKQKIEALTEMMRAQNP